MLIKVTQSHIEKGQRGSCTSDPVALALLEAEYIAPWVAPDRIEYIDKEFGYTKSIPIPTAVQRFITLFDQEQLVSPFEFEMEE